MERKLKQITAAVIVLMLICLAFVVHGESDTWDCPECGRTGNTGNFCGGCAYPSPVTVPAATLALSPEATYVSADTFSFDRLIRQYDTNYIQKYFDLREDAKKWISWTTNSAPQSLKEMPLFPDFIVPLYQSLMDASDKLIYEVEDTGSTYTIHSNIAEKFVLVSSGESYTNIGFRSDEVVLLMEEGITDLAEHKDIKILDSADSSISFSYPEGLSVRMDELRYDYRYIYYGDIDEVITIGMLEPGNGNPSFYVNVMFGDGNTSINYLMCESETVVIEIRDSSGGFNGVEWLEYDLQSGELMYWDMAYYEVEDAQ